MATYFFETITAAQALGFSSTADTLVFSNSTSAGSKMSVLYNAATATSAPTVTITDLITGHAVVFGTNVYGEGEGGSFTSPVFPDASTLIVGSPVADDTGLGTSHNDGLFGGDGNDTLSGSSGGDVLQGNQGNDILFGGDGNATTTGDGNDTIYGGRGNDTINA